MVRRVPEDIPIESIKLVTSSNAVLSSSPSFITGNRTLIPSTSVITAGSTLLLTSSDYETRGRSVLSSGLVVFDEVRILKSRLDSLQALKAELDASLGKTQSRLSARDQVWIYYFL